MSGKNMLPALLVNGKWIVFLSIIMSMNLRVPKDIYNISNFFDLNEEPEEVYSFTTKEGFTVRMNKLYRIAGTVLAKDKTKHSVTILTEDGVVNVKVWNSQFAKYDKQISEKQADGKKKSS